MSSSADAKSVREQLSLCSPEQSSLHESEGPSAHDTLDQEPHRSSHGDGMPHSNEQRKQRRRRLKAVFSTDTTFSPPHPSHMTHLAGNSVRSNR